MGRRFSRLLGSPARLDPGQFCFELGTVHIACPVCSGIDAINEGDGLYEIDRAGAMRPAWSCPWESCGFCDFVHLDGLEAM